MKKSNLKYYIGIFAIFSTDVLQTLLFRNNDKYDVYLFYDHSRYLTNIIYDISNMLTFSILLYFLIDFKKNIFAPLFIASLFWWLSYFTFYHQLSSLLVVPIYLIFVVYYNEKVFR